MRRFLRLVAVVLAVLTLAACIGCSGNSTVSLGTSVGDAWSYRYKDIEVPIGVYINYLNIAYQNASSKYDGDDMTADSLIKDDNDKEVKVSDYVKSEAERYCKEYIVLQLDAKELLKGTNYAYTESDVDQYIDDYFGQMESMYSMYGYSYSRDTAYSSVSQYGISKASYDASIAYDYYRDAIFKGLYATGGKEEVKDDEIEKYFTDNYTHYRYVFASYKETVADASATDTDATTETDVSDEKKAAYKKSFESIAKATKSAEDFENGVLSYMKENEITSDPTSARTEVLDDSTAKEEILNAVKELKNNTAKVVEAEDGSGIYVVFKGDIKEYVDFMTVALPETTTTEDADTADNAENETSVDAENTENGDTDAESEEPTYSINPVSSGVTRDTLLYASKDEAFKAYVKALVEKYDADIQANEKELAKYDVNMFIAQG
ncbi:MAG: hypothetical protein K6F76_05065 [Clostridiales bacterium]|nr:hypothetical protein [Clostridiales bacterium]